MKKLLMLAMILSLVASGAMAQKIAPKNAPKGDGVPYITAKLDYTEDFEGAFPPAGWTQGITNPGFTWIQDSLNPYTGTAAAYIPWQTGSPQDETLEFSWPVDVGDALIFATSGSPTWASNGNFTVEVNGTEVYNFDLENAGVAFVWEEVIVDLAAYEGTTPTFTFRYAGDDGADHYLDAVQIGAYEPPPPPDDISFCELVSEEFGTSFSGTTCGGQNLVSSLDCGTYTENGLESYYEIEIPSGCYFTATVTNEADGALWVLADCVAPGGAYTCLAYADDTFTGDAEVVTYSNDSGFDQVVYLVVDSFGTDSCGAFTFDLETDCAVAIEASNFGSVKALFR
ncbi:MAG: hypothetical protein QNL91_18500 [Candidatus Krumholzibacteria bacterium]|nr:hypothetical protein [Candidatus Krumholzibacteria bacterium]